MPGVDPEGRPAHFVGLVVSARQHLQVGEAREEDEGIRQPGQPLLEDLNGIGEPVATR